MDHDVYPYSPIEGRPPFRLPGGARVAVFILLHLEHRELTPPAGAYRDPRFRGEFGDFQPEYRTWTYREYGDRVGVFRLLSLFDAFSLPVSVAINAAAAERRPNLVREARSRGYELIAHGLSATQMITSRMSEDEERRHIAESRERLQRAAGVTPRGWLGQDYGVTARTSRLLAEAGFAYTLDWPNDEQPYWQNPDRSLVAVPSQPDWDDVQTLLLRRVPVHSFPQLVRDAIERLVAERDGARVFGLGVHPWMFGAPHRIRYLREALDAVAGASGVLPATTGQIAQWFKEGAGA
jgi:allantoinase